MAKIAILGFGVVGQGVYEVLNTNSRLITARTGEEFIIKRILDKRVFPNHPLGDRVTADLNDILNDTEISVVAETMGGTSPAYEFSLALIRAGKSVVTSNKAVVEKHGKELCAEAAKHGVAYLYEASAGGGIPVIHPILHCLAGNDIQKVCGILNGTTNYILTKMRDEGLSFDTALKQAQALGYAEADPTADVSGADAARKICILASLAFNTHIALENVSVMQGIEDVTEEDVIKAEKRGYAVKLIGFGEKTGDTARLFVAPCLVSKKTVLGITDDVINAVSVYGDCVGGVTFRGRGAGGKATASAVVSDILEAHSGKYVKEYKNEKVSFLNVNEGKDMLYIPETDEFIQPDTLENQLKAVGSKKYYRVVEIAE
ncbi:MAG: homoserine dehydrogenase [Clostridia bacterium]|nr:homoserine dehydrogenase [Clostridia bacterium]